MPFEFGIALTVAILVVTQQRMAGEGRMDADLMRPPGRDVHLHQGGERTEKLHRLEYAHRVLAGGGDPHMSLAVLTVVGRERRIDALCSQLPAAGNQSQISLVHAAVANQGMQRGQSAAIACYQQTAAGIAVEAVHQLQRFARPGRAQGFDDAKTHAAAAVYRDAGGLVDHQQMLVLINDRPFDQFQQAARGLPRADAPLFIDGVDAYGGQAHFVALLNAVFRIDALAVDAHFALAQQTVDPAAGHRLEVPHEKIVDPLTGLIGSYRAQDDGTLWPVIVLRHSHIIVHGSRSC